ncbi:Rossmann-like and DUF2520 domain-containing protein [Bacteroides gallinaceum]|uniref:Rossmann-like and DUF2520 domain-containing protein n=1 Tax=Bacteroides gallinaceum TaxID=1462571 RepID=UPI0015B3767A|nr:Rossmann-like and DUF2520 domain-containing protein [Bacteroides gallinaceum]MDM8153109.1 DUF2520 domain-containing protein [Bacteroides gallinaceum]
MENKELIHPSLSIGKVALIGAGNVATHLGQALCEAGYRISQVFSRTEASASVLSEKLACPYTTDIKGVTSEADLYLVSIKDSALAEVIPSLTSLNPKALFAHTAGSMPMDVWRGEAEHYGVLYPMQTFSKDRVLDFATVPFFIEGSGREEVDALKALAERIGGRVYEATSEQRKYLHIAAVFACNFTNHLYAVAHHLLASQGLPFEAMLPLIDETARKVHELEPVKAQTGPAQRYDENVIGKHLQMLADESELAEIYERMSRDIHRYALNLNNQEQGK